MTPHRPSRWIAPLALLAAIAAVGLVISNSTGSDDGDGGSSDASQQQERRGESEAGREETSAEEEATDTSTTTTPRRQSYTVRPGDTLALIAERTGVPVEELLELNPEIDPNSLTVGDKIKLTE